MTLNSRYVARGGKTGQNMDKRGNKGGKKMCCDNCTPPLPFQTPSYAPADSPKKKNSVNAFLQCIKQLCT